MPGSERQNNMFDESPVKNYKQEGNPFGVTSCGRRRNLGQKIFKMDSPLEKRKRKKSNEPRKTPWTEWPDGYEGVSIDFILKAVNFLSSS